jgi:hypothetical protein
MGDGSKSGSKGDLAQDMLALVGRGASCDLSSQAGQRFAL